MESILFGLVAYSAWGFAFFFEAIAVRKLNYYSLIFWGFFVSSLVLGIYAVSVVNDLYKITPGILLVSLFVVFCWVGGTIAYYKGLKVGNRSLVGAISAAFPSVTVVLSILILREKVNANQLGAVGLVLLGIILSTFDLPAILKGKVKINNSVLFAIVAMICWGAAFAFVKIPVQKIGWFWPNYFVFLTFPLIYFYMYLTKIKLEPLTKNNAYIIVIPSIILPRIAEFAYNIGISRGLVTIVAPIAGANPTLFVLLALLFFKDKITKQQIVGIVTTLAGIVLLSLFSI